MNIVNRSPKQLAPYPGNAKKHTKPQIEKVALSIQKYGFKQPVVIDREDVIVIANFAVLMETHPQPTL